MFDVQDLIKKKLAELPPALLAELPIPPRESLASETVGGIGQVPAPVTENTFVPQVNNPTNRFSQVPVIDEAAPVEPQPLDFQRKMAGALEVQQPKSLSEQLTELDQKNYSKGLYRRADGTETSSPTTDGIPNEVITPAGKDRDKKWSIRDKIASALIGFAQGGVSGAIQAGTNRNFLEQMKDRFKRAEILPKYQEEAARKAFETDQQKQQALLNEIKRKPEKEQADREFKFEQETQKQLNRLQKIQEERKLKGEDTAIVTSKDGSGRLAIRDANGKETLITNADGSYEYNLIEKPEAVQIEDGKNPDGTTKYKTVYAKGSQVLSNDSANKYREGMLALGEQRLKETKRSNKVREKLSQEKFTQGKQEFESVMGLRAAALANQIQQQSANNAAGATKFQLEIDKYDAMLEKMLVAARESHKDGELDNDQLIDLEEYVRSQRSK